MNCFAIRSRASTSARLIQNLRAFGAIKMIFNHFNQILVSTFSRRMQSANTSDDLQKKQQKHIDIVSELCYTIDTNTVSVILRRFRKEDFAMKTEKKLPRCPSPGP